MINYLSFGNSFYRNRWGKTIRVKLPTTARKPLYRLGLEDQGLTTDFLLEPDDFVTLLKQLQIAAKDLGRWPEESHAESFFAIRWATQPRSKTHPFKILKALGVRVKPQQRPSIPLDYSDGMNLLSLEWGTTEGWTSFDMTFEFSLGFINKIVPWVKVCKPW